MKIIIHERLDDGVSITPIHPNQGETEAAAINRVVDRNKEVGNLPADDVGVTIADESSLLGGSLEASKTQREFRGAWEFTRPNIEENLTKARVIQRDRIDRAKTRQVRKLLEREMLGEDITAAKAQLRTVNPQEIVDGAINIAALKSSWPENLSR